MGDRNRMLGDRMHDLFEEGAQIFVILRKIIDMAFAAVGAGARRAALSAPVEGRDRQSAQAQIVDHFAIFFEEFGLALQQNADAAKG